MRCVACCAPTMSPALNAAPDASVKVHAASSGSVGAISSAHRNNSAYATAGSPLYSSIVPLSRASVTAGTGSAITSSTSVLARSGWPESNATNAAVTSLRRRPSAVWLSRAARRSTDTAAASPPRRRAAVALRSTASASSSSGAVAATARCQVARSLSTPS
jgi:hypothetical protein